MNSAQNSLPTFSIVLPTYNGGRHLQDAVDSCLGQTRGDLEVVLVDDGSSDPQTAEILAGQSDPRVRIVRLKKNAGLPNALNAGFREARGELLTWTSDDNLFQPEALEVMARELERTGADFVYARATTIDEKGREIGSIVPRDPERLAVDNCIGPCFLFTRRVYEETGQFDPEMVLTEDYDYWIRVSKRFRMVPVDRDLYQYRFHEAALTATFGGPKIAERVDATRRRHFSKGRILAADGLRAFHRGDLAEGRRLLPAALARRPWDARLYRAAAICSLPGFLVRAIVWVKALFRSK